MARLLRTTKVALARDVPPYGRRAPHAGLSSEQKKGKSQSGRAVQGQDEVLFRAGFGFVLDLVLSFS